MKAIIALILLSVLSCAGTSFAAEPVALKLSQKGIDKNGMAYRHYLVRCSNGRKNLITSWEDGRRWCNGNKHSTMCSRKKIVSAKLACKHRRSQPLVATVK